MGGNLWATGVDPAHVVRTGLGFVASSARLLPGGDTAVAWLAGAERQAIRAIRHYCDEADPPDTAADATAVEDGEPEPPTPQAILDALMEQSIYNTPTQSRSALHVSLLQSIVPDEARILAAVSDGSAYPVLHVGEPGADPDGPLTLRNASTVGRAAGVAVPQRTPLYLTRLLQMGLLDIGAEDIAMRDDYEMLLTDAAVHAAITSTSRGLRSARIIRRTVRISELGHDVWQEATK